MTNLQRVIHWLELGRGTRWLLLALVLASGALLAAAVGWRLFQGPASEVTLAQLNLGRSLAEGRGFTTPVYYPRVLAWREARGEAFEIGQPFPELHQPPLYALSVAGALRMVPQERRASLWETTNPPPNGVGADYVILGLNIALLWVAVWQVWWLGGAWFGRWAGGVAAAATGVSLPLWRAVLTVEGAVLGTVLVLALAQALTRAAHREGLVGATRWGSVWWAVVGLVLGALTLFHESIWGLVPVVLVVAWRRGGGRAVALSGIVVALVASPWLVRNGLLTGNLWGLAGEQWSWQVGSVASDPGRQLATMAEPATALTLEGLLRKAGRALAAGLTGGWWAGGGYLLSGFCLAGAWHRFRRGEARSGWLIAVMGLPLLVALHGMGGTGRAGEPDPLVYGAPLLLLGGAGFLQVLIASSTGWTARAGVVATLTVGLHAVPLLHAWAGTSRLHFTYPPYYPAAMAGVGQEAQRRSLGPPAWMCDQPQGAAWYAGQTVWAQPASLREFYAIHARQPLVALLLTPTTLDRPYFDQLAKVEDRRPGSRHDDWSRIYRGLITGEWPAEFPLQLRQAIAPNHQVLVDERRRPLR
jgi:hypothetical protein